MLDERACLHHLFEAQVRRSPNAVALRHGDDVITYVELNRRANRLAHDLVGRGIGPEALVGICVARSWQMVAGLLAILKAGGAYVPLDPAYPRQRVSYMLADARPTIVLTRATIGGSLPASDARVIDLDAAFAGDGAPGDDDPESGVGADNLSYILYTSGSTGNPKGVAITHRSAVALIEWATRCYTADELAAVLASTSICFDLSVFELFVPLSIGGSVVLARDALELATLPAAVRVTLVNTVPSAMTELVRQGAVPASVRAVNLAGEPLLNELAQRVYTSAGVERLFNLYGPTEDTTYSTWTLVRRGDRATPSIGRAIDGGEVRLLDPLGEPVADGEAGEVYLGGTGLARGYLNHPALTSEKLIPDPFASEPGRRLYRTGDLARRRPDGDLDFLGRIDHQLKIRGFRIEPREIESALLAHPGVQTALAMARDDGPGGRHLVAYVVPDPWPGPRAEELRGFLRDRLPEYMIPAAFVALSALPLTPNGKVDRAALPAPDPGRRPDAASLTRPNSPLQQRLAAIWAGVLRVETVGIGDDFFALGGHSLLATRVLSRLRDELGVEVSWEAFFASPTVAGLSAIVESLLDRAPAGAATTDNPAVAPADDEPLRLSSAQERLWVLDRLAPGNPVYNVPAVYRLEGRLDIEALQHALDEIVRRHETLRSTFPMADGRPLHVIGDEMRIRIEVADLSGLPRAAAAIDANRLADEEASRPFDLSCGPLLRASLLRLDQEEHIFLLTMHHIVSDGWSLAIFAAELGTLYDAFGAGLPSPLPALPARYQDYARSQGEWLRGPQAQAQAAYWKRRLDELAVAELVPDRGPSSTRSGRGARQSLALPAWLTRPLKALSQAEGVTLYMTLLAAVQVLLHRHTGQDDVVVGSPIAVRDRAEFEGLIGLFINNLVLRTSLLGAPSFRELLQRVRETALGAYAHQALPFENLLDELHPRRDPGRNPLFQVLFNLYNFPDAQLQLRGLTVEALGAPLVGSLFDLTFYARERSDGLEFEAVYSPERFSAARIAEMLRQLVHLLEQVVADPEVSIARLSLVTPAAARVLPDPRRPLQRSWSGGVESRLHDQSERSPDALAVVDGNDRWTYAELECRSNQVANWLTAHGIGGDDVVAIHAPKCAGLVAALFGVLKAGAAFMILDPAHPPARLIEHLGQVRPRGWIALDTDVAVARELAEFVAAAPFAARLERFSPSAGHPPHPLLGFSTDGPSLPRHPDDRAYVVFTSGSTGTPKAVEGTHRPLSHFLQWHAETFRLTSADRFAMLSGLGHDPLLRDIFTPLWLGATLHIPRPSIVGLPGQLLDWMSEQRITVIHLTPVMGRLLAGPLPDGGEAVREARLPGLRAAFFGGDRLTRSDLSQFRRLAPAAAPINFYGATETPQAMAYFNAAPDAMPDAGAPSAADLVPLGHGIDDAQLLVLNGAGRQAGIGERGEICVRTPYLCRGYLHDPDATRERFRPNPYGRAADDRLYRTGDLGMYLVDGAVAFLGRADDQVKIRGFRVEPAEVEARIRQHPGVQDVAVVAVGERGGDREPRLTAYVVLNPLVRLTLAELRRFVQARLPEYMAPAVLVVLERLPLTPNGKLDRRALPALEAIHPDRDAAYVAPRGRLERTVAAVWCGVLGLKAVGLHDNFFDVGGSSLAMVEVHARLQTALGRQLSIIDLFTHSDIQSLVEYLGRPPTEQSSLKRAEQRIDARARARNRRTAGAETSKQRRQLS